VGKQKVAENRSNREEEGAPWLWQPPRSGRGAHWPEVSRSPPLLRFGASFWFADFFPWIIGFGLIGLAFQLSSLGLASTHIFLLNTWPESR